MNGVVALIPARAGSKGVRGKNLRRLMGYPLIAYSIRAALETPGIDRVLFSTESEEYAEIARGYGAETPFLRPAELASDEATDYEVVFHALEWLKANSAEVPRWVVHLRPTTPLRDPDLIDQAIRTIRNHDQATALRSVHEMPETAYKMMQIHEGRLLCAFTESPELDEGNRPRQQYPKTYQPNGYVDVLKSEFVLNHPGKVHGNHVLAFETPPVVEVDSENDFHLLEFSLAQNDSLFKRLFPEG